MKKMILIVGLICFTSCLALAQKYKHKTEAEIAAMTPAQRVDEWVNEQVHHLKYWETDKHDELIKKYVLLDGMKAVPRITEIIDAYDPTTFPEGKGKLDERFRASYSLLHFIDSLGVRLRSAEEGRKVIDALERSIARLRKSKYDTNPNAEYGRKDIIKGAESILNDAKGINWKDNNIKSTLRFVYKIRISDEELIEFINFLVSRYPDYPNWSEVKTVKDESELGPAGYPVVIGVLKKPERFHEAYLEFKRTK